MGRLNAMKRSFYIFIFFLFVLMMLCSCSFVTAVQDNNEIEKQKEKIAEDILDYVIEGQTDSLYEMFATVDKTETTRQQLNNMFESVNWEDFVTNKIEANENGGGAKYREGEVVQESFGYKYEHIVDKDNNEYTVGFGYTLINDEEPDKIGLNRLSIRLVNYKDGYIPVVLEEYIAGRE